MAALAILCVHAGADADGADNSALEAALGLPPLVVRALAAALSHLQVTSLSQGVCHCCICTAET
jgi:hypothetical protein